MLHTVIVLDNNLTVGLLPPAVKCPIHKIPLVCPACLGSDTGRRKTQAARKNGVLGAGRWGVKTAGRASLKENTPRGVGRTVTALTSSSPTKEAHHGLRKG